VALTRRVHARVLAATACAALAAGCSASVRTAAPAAARAATADAAPASAKSPATVELEAIERDCPDARSFPNDGRKTVWWQGFPRTNEALRAEIDRRADALRSGPIGHRARKLASLRLVATAHDLVEAGADAGAAEALAQAVSLDAGNGYAWLLMASVTRGPKARELADRAERTLPRDPGVRCELRGLQWTLRNA
jgi:hypothetical protein